MATVPVPIRSLLLSKSLKSGGSGGDFGALLANDALWCGIADAGLDIRAGEEVDGVDYFRHDLKSRLLSTSSPSPSDDPIAFVEALADKFIPIKMLYDSDATYLMLGFWRRGTGGADWVPAVLKHAVEPAERDAGTFERTGKSREVYFTEIAHEAAAGPRVYFSTSRRAGRRSIHTLCVLEYVGASLAKLVSRQTYLRPSEVVDIFIQIAEQMRALGARDVLHSDLKLQNVCVRYSDEDSRWRARLIDFGMASARSDPGGRYPDAGTESELPPELREDGTKPETGPDPDAEDSWGFGAMLWHLFEFRGPGIPHPCDDPSAFASDNSARENAAACLLLEVLGMTLGLRPSERRPMSEVLEVLRRAENIAREHRGGIAFEDPSFEGARYEGPGEPYLRVSTDIGAIGRLGRVVIHRFLWSRYRGYDGDDIVN